MDGSKPLKVLFFSYPSSFQNVGGGEILLLKLKEYLEKAGCSVRLFDMWRDKVEDFDFLHVFGTVKDCLGLVEVAKARKVKVVVSPILWSSWRRAFFSFGSVREKTELLLRHAVKVACPVFPSKRRRILMLADLVIPNAESEKDQVQRLFAVPAAKMAVVKNGVDRRFYGAAPDLFRKTYGSEPFILGVGRIEPRKNELNLIRAVKKMGGRLVLIGGTVSGFERYEAACREEGKGFTRFLGPIGHEGPMLESAYAAAKVFALPGWFETPGLAALEAALAGTPLACTEVGSTREYFGGDAAYFNPASVDSIARALANPPSREQSSALRERVLKTCTWEAVAEATMAAYRRLAEHR